MSLSALQTYVRLILSHLSLWHLVVIGILSFGIAFLLCKKCSRYGAVVLGITVFIGLFLLDAAVVNRYFSDLPHVSCCRLNLHRLIHRDEQGRIELFSNLAAFIPSGFFLSEFLASTKRLGAWRRIFVATLAALGLSLCIESLQLVLKVGFFEVTDLVLNTVGGFLGAGASALLRSVRQLKQVRP